MTRKLPKTTVDTFINDVQDAFLKNSNISVYKFDGFINEGASFKGIIRRVKQVLGDKNGLIVSQPPILTEFIVNDSNIIDEFIQFENEQLLLKFLRENLDDEFAKYIRSEDQIKLDKFDTALFQASLGYTPKGFSNATFSFKIQDYDNNSFLNKYKELLYIAHNYLEIDILVDTSDLIRKLNCKLYNLIVSMSDSVFINKLIDIKFHKIENYYKEEKFNLNKLLFLTYIDIIKNIKTFYVAPGAQKTISYYSFDLELMQNWC